MNWKKNLTVLGLAILIEKSITYLFEPKWIGGPATFPLRQFSSLLWNAGVGIPTSVVLAYILAIIFWFIILLLALRVIKFISKILRKAQ